MDALINYLDKYTDELVFLQIGIMVILATIIVSVYLYNRKKYHNLKHQIPASVVKNYLDSIIQNSTALKSSLFRGGGLEVDPSGVPSVFPLDQLAGAGAVAGAGGGDEALRAEVARLQAQLAEKNLVVTDLEGKNTALNGDVKQKQERIEELERMLAEGGGAPADDSALSAELVDVKKERDQLKEELEQYNIIADDLADLKRHKQENEQLRKALEDGGGEIPATPEPEPAAEAAPVVEPEPEAAPEPVEAAAPESVEAAAPESAGDEKSPEDLLSEFEKMLG